MWATDARFVLLAAGVTWVEAALVLFFVMFLAVVIWTVVAKRDRFHAVSRIPLQDDRPVEPRLPAGGDRTGKESAHVR
ncbi:MAG: cbb3-type cytochrome c oxidase subunit 3 [Phycisphaeraceae bacterium]|nr:CcoQ/FixQ family Cbb3-type cytochrome c oxidase assembly chaperone [Phycisphaerales bacterium]QOJ18072.1 MAG: cbb3-type cytochrome c oxidase subunit 3 [Phycisphaeraceae bacterium]